MRKSPPGLREHVSLNRNTLDTCTDVSKKKSVWFSNTRESDEPIVAIMLDDGTQKMQRCQTVRLVAENSFEKKHLRTKLKVSVTTSSIANEDEPTAPHEKSKATSHATPSPTNRDTELFGMRKVWTSSQCYVQETENDVRQ